MNARTWNKYYTLKYPVLSVKFIVGIFVVRTHFWLYTPTRQTIFIGPSMLIPSVFPSSAIVLANESISGILVPNFEYVFLGSVPSLIDALNLRSFWIIFI